MYNDFVEVFVVKHCSYNGIKYNNYVITIFTLSVYNWSIQFFPQFVFI